MTNENKKRKGYSTKEAQAAADKRYYHASEENRRRKRYTNAKSTAKRFIETLATADDLEDLKNRIEKNHNVTTLATKHVKS